MSVSENQDSEALPARSGAVRDNDDVIDLRDLVWFWLKWIWVLVPFAVIGAYQGYKNLQAFQPKYEAFLVVAPEGGSGGAAGLSPGAGSVLRGIGINVDSSAQSQTFERLKVILGSVVLAERLQEKHGLLQEVYGGAWDENRQEWIVPSGEEFERSEKIREFLRRNPWRPPSVEQLASYTGGGIDVETDNISRFSVVTFQHVNQDFALRFLSTVYSEADELVREQDRERSRSRISYVEEQLGQTTNVDSRQTLFGILAGEQQKAMLLSSGLPYAARIIDGPGVSRDRTEPNVRFIFAVPIFGWTGVAFILMTLLFLFWRESRKRR